MIQREAKESVERLSEEIISMRNRLNIFRTRYRSLLESELEKFDNFSAELFEDKDMEELKPYPESRIVTEERFSYGKATITNLRKGEGV